MVCKDSNFVLVLTYSVGESFFSFSSFVFLDFICVCVSELASTCCSCCGIGSFRIRLYVVEGEMKVL